MPELVTVSLMEAIRMKKAANLKNPRRRSYEYYLEHARKNRLYRQRKKIHLLFSLLDRLVSS